MRDWYTHRWNTATALRLILNIIPRVPRPLVPPIGVVTTAVCVCYMRRERAAARRNLSRILGTDGWPVHRAVWRLFYNFSRFMVSYCELPHLTPERLRSRLVADHQDGTPIRDALSRGNGAIALTAHLGNWEAGIRLLALTGTPVSVVMQIERSNPSAGMLLGLREQDSIRILDVGEGPDGILALRAALARNEIVAMQGDRFTGGHFLNGELFGAPFRFPAGPFLFGYGCRAPIIPAFVVQEGWWRWRREICAPVQFPRTGNRDADLSAGVAQYAAHLERVVRRYPDQWFNFFDLWLGAENR